MNLRDEILDLIVQGRVMKTNERETRDEILKLIEKRIDKSKELEEEAHGGYHGDEEFWAGFSIGFEQAIEVIKKELLK